ncbi:probable Na+/H+ antiporter [Crocosphaera subtropica ATCC 51142]|uniref:Probable Na+/H+ antiporter n=1 Tax=Crocosphaera subtropica (strain ATCC 51142 / BH68) TaxID=43989 RepID=B1X0U6_CROS5|nr:cation:proton antiporter [Crocosphaera subtropica]ACB52985.1 probable Na+/H+ antiporter [Crocosphaera subtropica ATCC 51142]
MSSQNSTQIELITLSFLRMDSTMELLTNPFYETAFVLLVSTIVGAMGLALRQPLIVAFIAVGILVGPSAFGWVIPSEEMELFAELGIALLLFVVGLKLDLHLIQSMGSVALATGFGQVAFTSIVGFLISLLLGFTPLTAVYIAVALTFSSTIIIVKLLSDKREIDSLHGRIALGFLIVQDLVVVLVMIGLSALGGDAALSPGITLLQLVLKGGLLLLGVGVMMAFVLPKLLHHLAQSQELLLIFAIAWAVTLSALSEILGFSSEVGAFLSGISLASTRYRDAIGSRLVSIRDFLLLFFFVNLGAHLDLHLLGAQIVPALVLSLFVLIGNPTIVMAIMGYMGYRKRTSLLSGLTVAQISEFSLILAALGLSLGHIDEETVGLITLVGLITIGVSTYMILYSHLLYEWLSPTLSIFERRIPHREEAGDTGFSATKADVIVYGLGRYGGWLVNSLSRKGLVVHGVDFDPENVRRWRRQGFLVHYGDAEDPEYPSHLPLNAVKWVVSSIPGIEINLTLLHALQHYDYKGKLAVTIHKDHEDEALQTSEVDLILRPFVDAAEQAAEELFKDLKEGQGE